MEEIKEQSPEETRNTGGLFQWLLIEVITLTDFFFCQPPKKPQSKLLAFFTHQWSRRSSQTIWRPTSRGPARRFDSGVSRLHPSHDFNENFGKQQNKTIDWKTGESTICYHYIIFKAHYLDKGKAKKLTINKHCFFFPSQFQNISFCLPNINVKLLNVKTLTICTFYLKHVFLFFGNYCNVFIFKTDFTKNILHIKDPSLTLFVLFQPY